MQIPEQTVSPEDALKWIIERAHSAHSTKSTDLDDWDEDMEIIAATARAALATTMATVPVAADPDVEYIHELIFKLECFIDHATGNKLSKSSWALETLKAAHDEHVNAVIEEAMKDAPVEAIGEPVAKLQQALREAQVAINSMKDEAETAAQGDEQMMLEACETISARGLEADMQIRALLDGVPYAAEPAGAEPFGYVTKDTRGGRHFFESAPYLDNAVECVAVFSKAPAEPAGLSDAQDAERYRWLRAQCEMHGAGTLTIASSDGYGLQPWSGDDPDRAIDAALAASAPAAPDLAQPQPGTGSGS